jgi:membrane peptidoglycan carboxypeptidase
MSTSVWVGYPNALVEMRSVHGISVAGGTFPAQIWRSFMTVAKGDDCDAFRPSVDTPEFSPFYGEYASTGTTADTDYDYKAPAPKGPGDDSAGGDDYHGYDPRLYETPPQEVPETEPTPEEKPPPDDSGGVEPGEGELGNGNGQGNGNAKDKGKRPKG